MFPVQVEITDMIKKVQEKCQHLLDYLQYIMPYEKFTQTKQTHCRFLH